MITLTRYYTPMGATLGTLEIADTPRGVWSCVTIELPWKDNQRSVSCIPEGDYKMRLRRSPVVERTQVRDDVLRQQNAQIIQMLRDLKDAAG